MQHTIWSCLLKLIWLQWYITGKLFCKFKMLSLAVFNDKLTKKTSPQKLSLAQFRHLENQRGNNQALMCANYLICILTFLHARTIFFKSYSDDRPCTVVKVFRPLRCWILICTRPSWTSSSEPLIASAKGSKKKLTQWVENYSFVKKQQQFCGIKPWSTAKGCVSTHFQFQWHVLTSAHF